MNKKYTIVGLLVFFLWIPFSFAQEVSLKNAKKLFKDNKFQESAKIFLQLANEREDSEAFYHLGRIFSEGLGGIKQQRRVGFEYYKRGAEQKHIPSQTKYAIYYLAGEFVLKDYKKAIQLFEKSAKEKDIEALLILGGLYSSGTVIKKNAKKAFQNYEIAAKLDNGVAAYRLGNFYEEGTYVSKSDKKALEWYRKAAGKKFPPSFLKLAEYFRDGKEVKTNLVYAHAYFNVASSLGSNQAKEEIAKIEKVLSVEDSLKAQTIARRIQQNPATKLK